MYVSLDFSIVIVGELSDFFYCKFSVVQTRFPASKDVVLITEIIT